MESVIKRKGLGKMKKWKQKIAALLAIVMTVGLFPANIYADEVKLENDVVVNPLYQDEIITTTVENERQALAGRLEYDAEVNSLNEAAEYLKQQMVLRNTQVRFRLNDANAYSIYGRELGEVILEKAIAYTDNCSGQEGDALAFGYQGACFSMQIDMSGITIICDVQYHTSKAQEDALTAQVNVAMSEMNLNSINNSYQKIKVIHDYICNHVNYDYTYSKYSAYHALCTGTSVCQGYAVLFYRLCKEAGYSVRIISGKGYGEDHAWNIVKVNGRYYNVDCTWDGQEANATYDTYLLKNENDFPNHKRDEEYSTVSFMLKYPMATTSYDFSANNDNNDNNQDNGNTEAYTGLKKENGKWVYYTDGEVDKWKYGFVDYAGGKFLVAHGTVASTISGLAPDPNNTDIWYYLSKGQVQTQYTGLAQYGGEWFYVNQGVLNTTMAGYVTYDTGLFYLAAGRILKEESGLRQDPVTSKWYYLANGQAQTQYTGLAQYDGAWFYVVNGALAEDYTGTVQYDGAEFYVVNGKLL